MLRIINIKTPVTMDCTHNGDCTPLKEKVAKQLRIAVKDIKEFKLSGKAIDARDKKDIRFVYSADISIADEQRYLKLKNVRRAEPFVYIVKRFAAPTEQRPVVVGSGPAGLFAGLILAEYGLCPIILEQGRPVLERRADVYRFFKTGVLDPGSNIQFGEGGAGTFSDGKLTTNTHDVRIGKVIEEFIKAGADEAIAYEAKPHIGTDRLVEIIRHIRARIESLGGEYRFGNKMTAIHRRAGRLTGLAVATADGDYELETDVAVLAIGHSARDTFTMLQNSAVQMAPKPFAVGLRIEHRQDTINRLQYGAFAEQLPAADYKASVKLADGRTVYTFCMCPGGMVVPAASEAGCLAVNGMSASDRRGENANAALLVNVTPADFGGDDALAGIAFQRRLEKAAYALGGGGYSAPAQLTGDFIHNRPSENWGSVTPSYRPGCRLTDLNPLFPAHLAEALKKGLLAIDQKIRGFCQYDAVLTAIETRSSSPVRIPRDGRFFSNIEGIIPCGEGAGYAGGIISAAVDGIRCAEAVCTYYKKVPNSIK